MHLADLAFLAFKGLLVAFIPLSLIWVGWGRRGDTQRGSRTRRLAWVTVFFTFDLIVFGGFTRLTDSGLGCPDWPGCYAKANPIAAMHDIHAAEAAMPTGPVTMTKAWIEMIHRYLAMGVGVLIIVMVVLAWRRYLRMNKPIRIPTFLLKGKESPWLPTALLALVCLQGAFGAWTVTMKLQPVIVTTHLLLAMLLLILLVWNAMRMEVIAPVAQAPVPASLRRLALVAAALLVIQIALGGWVSTNYAVLACSEFPLCQGQLVPDMDFANGFHLWRELGRTADDGFLPFTALVAIHWVHRSFAYMVFAVLGVLAWKLLNLSSSLSSLSSALRRNARMLAALLAAQFLTGLINVLFAWPLLAAVLHNAGAAALVLVMTLINYRLQASPVLASSSLPRQPASAAST